MEDNLIELLESFEVPVYRQGSMSNDEEYPETFITFWNNETPIHSYYDNNEYGATGDFDVNVYSSDPDTTYNLLMEVRDLLRKNKWISSDRGHDVASDEATHTGRGLHVLYFEI